MIEHTESILISTGGEIFYIDGEESANVAYFEPRRLTECAELTIEPAPLLKCRWGNTDRTIKYSPQGKVDEKYLRERFASIVKTGGDRFDSSFPEEFVANIANRANECRLKVSPLLNTENMDIESKRAKIDMKNKGLKLLHQMGIFPEGAPVDPEDLDQAYEQGSIKETKVASKRAASNQNIISSNKKTFKDVACQTDTVEEVTNSTSNTVSPNNSKDDTQNNA